MSFTFRYAGHGLVVIHLGTDMATSSDPVQFGETTGAEYLPLIECYRAVHNHTNKNNNNFCTAT